MSFFKVLSKPHHSSTLSIRGLIHSFVTTLVVVSLAFIFKPFGLKNLESSELVNTVITIGGITFLMMIIAQFLFPLVIKDFYSEEKWTTGKQFTQLLLMSFLIVFSCVLYVSSKGLADFPLDAIILFGITIVPLGLLALIQQNLLVGKFTKLASDKNSDLSRKSVINSKNAFSVLSFEGRESTLNLIPNQLIYIKLGNKSEFYYQNMLGVDKTTLSISQKAVIDALEGHPQFERFGNDVVLNINAIQQIQGTARGYDLIVAKINEIVKVSHKERKKVDGL